METASEEEDDTDDDTAYDVYEDSYVGTEKILTMTLL